MICRNCGVELEDDMMACPLCREPVNGNTPTNSQVSYGTQSFQGYREMSKPQKKFTWEIISIILLSAAVATFVVNFIINRSVTWSEYPVAICLTIFCYVSLFAFWERTMFVEMAGGFVLSSLCLMALDLFTAGIQWSVKLAIPLLFMANIITTILIAIIRQSRYKGINLIAYGFLAAAILCVFIDGSLSFFKSGSFQIKWSIIVFACTIPVIIVLLFVHFRLKKGRSLEKTFHV